jgi:hypothetical protein
MSRGGKLISRGNLVYPKVFSRDIDKLTKAQSLWNCPEGFTIFCMVEPIQQLTLQKGCPMICGKNAITRTGILPCPALQITACNATPVLVSNPSCPQALSKQNGTWSGEIFSPLHTNMPPHIQYTLEKRCYGSNLAHERLRVFRRIHSPLLDVSDGEYPGTPTMAFFKRDNHDYCDILNMFQWI